MRIKFMLRNHYHGYRAVPWDLRMGKHFVSVFGGITPKTTFMTTSD